MFNGQALRGQSISIINTGGGLNGDNAGKNRLMAVVTNTCSACDEDDIGIIYLSLSLMRDYGLTYLAAISLTGFNVLLENSSDHHPGPAPTEFCIQW